MNQQRTGCLGLALIACLALLGLSVALNFIFALGSSPTMTGSLGSLPKPEEKRLLPGDKHVEDKIAVIYLRGMISGLEPGGFGDTAVDDIKIQLRHAGDDPKVKAIVLHIDSPGGEVTASDTIYEALRKFRDEKKKPIVAYMGALAASGGYYVACGTSHIIANDTTFTGSIGVIMSTIKYKSLSEKVGVEMVTFKSGKFKDMLSGARDLSDEEKEYVQRLIMQTYDKFVGIVARERKLDEGELRNGPADGRVITGKDALEAKLIDQIGSVEDAYAKAMDLGRAKGAQVFRYEAPFKFGRLFSLLGEASSTRKVEIDLTSALLPKLQPGRAYYLSPFLAP
jgi:protease-4